MSNMSNKGLKSLYSSSSMISDFGIAFNTIYMSFIKENADITDLYNILINYN